MAATDIVFVEGFGFSTVASEYADKGFSVPSLVTGGGPYGQNCGRWNKAYTYVDLPSSADKVAVSFRLRLASLSLAAGAIQMIVAAVDSSLAKQWCLSVANDGVLRLLRGWYFGTSDAGSYDTSATTVATGPTLSSNTWYHIEVVINTTNSGSYELYVDGVLVSSGSADMQNSGTSGVSRLYIGNQSGSYTGSNGDLCDIVVQGGAGASSIGQVRVEWLDPAGSGSHSDFTGSDGNSVDNYAMVDEDGSNDDTSYIESDTIDDADTFTFDSLSSTPASILAVATTTIAKKTDSGSRELESIVRVGGTDYSHATAINCTDGYVSSQRIFSTNPATGSAWTAAAVASLEAGVKVSA